MAETQKIEEQLIAQREALEAVWAAEAAEEVEEEEAVEVESFEILENVYEEGATNPLAERAEKTSKKSLVENADRIKKAEAELLGRRLSPLEEMKDSAERFSKKNPELQSRTLQLLADKIKDCKSPEELRDILSAFYTDPTLADDALDFLLTVTQGDLNELVKLAKEQHNTQFGREITAGKNIQAEVMKAAEAKLGAPKSLRDLYREITGNPREPVSLFLELSDRFAYKDLRKVLAFLFHSLGSDLKAAGPSVPAGLLYRLLSETRSLQAILGVFTFFRSRMGLINSLFQRNGLTMPKELNFELLARQFVTLLQERYPSGDKVLSSAKRLGIEDWIIAKIIIFSQLRDAIREVALHKLYRSIDHRNDLYNSILEALESLEDELEELLEEEEEEEEEEGGKKKKRGKKGEQEPVEEVEGP